MASNRLPELEHTTSGEVDGNRDRLLAFLAQQNIALDLTENIAPALGVSYCGRIPAARLVEGRGVHITFLNTSRFLVAGQFPGTSRVTAGADKGYSLPVFCAGTRGGIRMFDASVYASQL